MKQFSRMLLGAAGLWLAGCGSSTSLDGGLDPGSDPGQTPEPVTERALGSYLRNLSTADDSVTLENAILEQYRIPTSDGAILDAWVRRPPNATEKLPLILVVSPYYGGGNPDSAPYIIGNVFAIAGGGSVSFSPVDPSRGLASRYLKYGYAVGFLSITGTGNSTGCFQNGGPIERRQVREAIEHLAAQAWSNGHVGATGASADGSTANALFAEPTPAVKAVVPVAALSDYYRYSFNNGIRRGINSLVPTYYWVLTGLNPSGIEGGLGPVDPLGFVMQLGGEVCAEQLGYQLDGVYSFVTGDKTPYWQERDLTAIVETSPEVPRPAMFYVQGLQDANVDTTHTAGWLEAIQKTDAPWHAWLGQWVHAWPQSGPRCEALAPCRGDYWDVMLLAWFDQFLKGRDTGVLETPRIQVQADDGVWRHEDQWPPQAVETLDLHLTAEGVLVEAGQPVNGAAGYSDSVLAGTIPDAAYEITAMLNDMLGPLRPVTDGLTAFLGGSQAEFVSEPLPQDLRLTGAVRFETVATASLPFANLLLTLKERTPDGIDRYLSFAATTLNHAESVEQGRLNVAGVAMPVGVDFFPQDIVVRAGSRLVLVAGGAFADEDDLSGNASNLQNFGPNLLAIGLGADVSLDLGLTRLRLPINHGDRVEPLPWLPDEDEVTEAP